MAQKSVGEFLAALRKAHGLTQQQAADRLCVSNRTVSAWENNAALPDVLLLPAIAKLYGVSVDEILAGEKREIESLSQNRKLPFKSFLSKFISQEYILGGVLLSGLILFFVGIFTELRTIYYTGIRWWLILLFVGLSASIVSLATFFALYHRALGAFEKGEGFKEFFLSLKRCAAKFLYVFSFALLSGAIFSLIFYFESSLDSFLALFLALFILSLSSFLFGFFSVDRAFLGILGGEYEKSRAKNKKIYKKAALLSLIPIALSLALAITLSLLNFTSREILYSSDRESFRIFMETVEVDGREYHIPLSSLSEKLGTEIFYGERYPFEENVSYYFYPNGFCEVQIKDGAIYTVFDAERLTAEDGFFVYNLHEGMMGSVTIGGDTVVSMHEEIRTEGELAFYERVFVQNYGAFFRALSAGLSFVSLGAAFLICFLKRERTEIAKISREEIE